ncbi:phage major capsid protein [Bosea sp. MMO-172]|uniref:phage major capsid protein n=1 Tax=Bosea sp. MMO-172 TaxID=3127885 RepID=UPI003015B4D4
MSERLEIKADVSFDDAGTVKGLAWPFGSPDRVGDTIRPGAFKFAKAVPMVMEHDGRQIVGVWEDFTETDAGLEVSGRLFVEGISPARSAHRHLKSGSYKGLSIAWTGGFYERRADGGREFTDITINEISLCRSPVHPGARVTIVKAMTEEPDMANEAVENTSLGNVAVGEAVTNQKAFDALAAQVEALKVRADKAEAKANRLPASNDNQSNDNIERKAFTDFLRTGQISGDGAERKALTVANDAPSYVLAPEETSSEFIRNLVEFSPVRAIADVKSAGSHTVVLPKRLSVTNAKWKGEAVASEASEPTFGEMEIAIKELNTHVDISNWLLEDAQNVESEVRLALAEDFGAKEGAALVNGSAAAEPKGFMTETGIAQSLNGHATNLSADALISLMYALPGVYRGRGTWAMNGSTLATIRKLKDGQGNYLWQPSYQAGQPETILGRPVVELIDMPDVAANAFPVIFGDFKAGYRIYDRIELAVRPNPYLLATEGLVRFHARRRVGAGVVRTDVFRKLKMATS